MNKYSCSVTYPAQTRQDMDFQEVYMFGDISSQIQELYGFLGSIDAWRHIQPNLGKIWMLGDLSSLTKARYGCLVIKSCQLFIETIQNKQVPLYLNAIFFWQQVYFSLKKFKNTILWIIVCNFPFFLQLLKIYKFFKYPENPIFFFFF